LETSSIEKELADVYHNLLKAGPIRNLKIMFLNIGRDDGKNF
jgi:hypothetical protein